MKSKIEPKFYNLTNSEFYNVLENIKSAEDFENMKNTHEFLKKYENYLETLKDENKVGICRYNLIFIF